MAFCYASGAVVKDVGLLDQNDVYGREIALVECNFLILSSSSNVERENCYLSVFVSVMSCTTHAELC